MDYIKNIHELCGKADSPGLGYAQITIDFFQEFEDQFFDNMRDLNEFPIERDELISKQYQISTLLDVMNSGSLPTVEEAGAIAVKISEHLTAQEQGFFIAGFQECIKHLMQNAKFQKDIELFNKMYAEIGEWAKAVEARNMLLGIPKHKG
jgi:hypothetical protein